MKKLAKFLLTVLPVFLAGYAAWCFIPCQPERSYLVPNETKLLNFSPAGRYVLTFQRGERRMTLWRVDTGEATYSAKIPFFVQVPEATECVRWFYGFSCDERWLAVATGSLDDSRLIIVDLDSNNASTPVCRLPPNRDRYIPQPAFSSDRRYLVYFSQTPEGKNFGVLYDIAAQHEQLHVPGAFACLGPPTREGKWFLPKGMRFIDGEKGIESWDVAQKRRDDGFPPWPNDHTMIWTSLSPDGRAVNAVCIADGRRFPTDRIFLNRCDLNTRTIETAWEYKLPPSTHLFWNGPGSEPDELLLIKTLNDQGNVVQDLLEVSSGDVLARFPEPINMVENFRYSNFGQTLFNAMDEGWIYTLGRPGQIAIDSERRVLVSKQIGRESLWWKYFGTWLGLRQAPTRLYLQFHSAQTGQLFERVSLQTPYQTFDPVLVVHPSKPILAVIDEQPTGPRLQFWKMPPPKPWGWISVCALAAGAFTALLRFGFANLVRRRKPPIRAG